MNSTLRKPLPPVDPLNPRVYLDLQLGGEQVGVCAAALRRLRRV